MKPMLCATVIGFVLVTVGCSKKEETEVVPPGFCRTEAECQPVADRQQAVQKDLRDRLIAQGVHEQYLPCGSYKATKAPNGFWIVTQDKNGCPATASQQDPHPDRGAAKVSR